MIDTDILIDEMRGLAAAAAFLNRQRLLGSLPVSIITAMELVQGSPDAAGLRLVQRFLSRLVILPVTEPISRTALHLLEGRSLSHGLRIADALIAATALTEGIPLYSRNVRHFRGIAGLTVIRPY